MRLTSRQRRLMLEVVVRMHRRDQDQSRMPPLGRGPTRGLWRAAVDAVDGEGRMPDLRELPPNVVWAVMAARVLRSHPVTHTQLDPWLVRNLAGTYAPPHLAARLPMVGCRSWEDVRNRLIADLDLASAVQLARWEAMVVPGSIRRARLVAQGLASAGRGGVSSSS